MDSTIITKLSTKCDVLTRPDTIGGFDIAQFRSLGVCKYANVQYFCSFHRRNRQVLYVISNK